VTQENTPLETSTSAVPEPDQGEISLEVRLQRLLDAQVQAREMSAQLVALEAQRLTAENQKTLYEQRRAAAQETIADAAVKLEPKIAALTLAMQYNTAEVRAMFDLFERQLKQTNHVLTLLLELNRLRIAGIHTREDRIKMDTLLGQADRAASEMEDSRLTTIQKSLIWLNRSLNEKKIQEAMAYPSPSTELLNEISALEGKIELMSLELDQIQSQAKGRPVQ
jgi:hypothetical protein